MNDEPQVVEGGQGRDADDVVGSGGAIVWVFACALAWVLAWVLAYAILG